MKEDFIKENINKDFVNKAKWIEKLRLFYKWVNITEGRNFFLLFFGKSFHNEK